LPQAGSVRAALEPLFEMGGDYEVERSGDIVCTNCLFAEVCRREPKICQFHAGVISGLTGSQVESLGHRDPGCAYIVGRS
jgi:predicted ArsR family transcriptional regulator